MIPSIISPNASYFENCKQTAAKIETNSYAIYVFPNLGQPLLSNSFEMFATKSKNLNWYSAPKLNNPFRKPIFEGHFFTKRMVFSSHKNLPT